jgi:hypothetical protein
MRWKCGDDGEQDHLTGLLPAHIGFECAVTVLPAASISSPARCTPAPQAFLHDYEKWPLFHTGEGRHAQQNLDEFDDARETVASLSAEYRAAEHRDFVSGSQPVVPRRCWLWCPPCASQLLHAHSSVLHGALMQQKFECDLDLTCCVRCADRAVDAGQRPRQRHVIGAQLLCGV